jgi:ribosomal protein S18 acetylase RimI-like enzyme
MKIIILTKTKWETYKKIRLDSLKNNPEAYGSKFDELKNKDDKYWKKKLEDRNNLFFIAFKSADPVGLVRVALNDIDIPPGYAYIGSLYVKREFRRKGVARKLILEAEKYIKKKTEMKGILIEVYESLEDAILLYKKLGYSTIKRRISDGGNELIMRKELINKF